MNYCPACRRHLNGALACAGCGTPAEQLIAAGSGAPAPTPPGPPPPQPALAEVFADSLIVMNGPAHGGRAGARRRAANRRRGGRTALTVGLGLLLATGGSIAVARIVSDDEGADRAAEVVLVDDAEPRDPQLPPDGDGLPAGPSALPTAKASGGAAKTAGSGGGPSGSARPGASGSASASAGTGPSAGATEGGGVVRPTGPGQPAPDATGPAKPPGTAPTQTKPGQGTPPKPTTTPKPTPKPTPTEECSFWNLWCI
ncbi:hypothetical protein [Streptomyces sp. RerS4]|uniref:SCO2400 family protein n=1 Tax=Streptomyces sp. RerS4 TaxID=2942449 RepID=UPI00201BEC94|nr:hypothetical protein [Streptomyces sp. RerS4]UQX01050.1 hypothetical protein M4D82_11295 [Streptomyces sp. RerS4]